MPGFRHCSWCSGKGCMCCDAEEAKWNAAQVAMQEKVVAERKRKAKADAARRAKQLADPKYIAFATKRILPIEARPFLWPAGGQGFRYCTACNAQGCFACGEAESAFLRSAIEDTIWWRQDSPDVRDLRDAIVRIEDERAARGLDSLSKEQVEAALKPALDAEYLRQFPDGPKPIVAFRRDKPADVALLGAFTKWAAEAFEPGGGGVAEVERTAELVRRIRDHGQFTDGATTIVIGGSL